METKINIQAEKDIEKLRKAAIELEKQVISLQLEILVLRGPVDHNKLKEIVDFKRAKDIIKKIK